MSRKRSNPRNWNPATLAIHGHGRLPKANYAVATQIMHASDFYFDNTAQVYEFKRAKSEGRLIREHEYGRYVNPIQTGCERKQAAVEGAERAVLSSTGMAAASRGEVPCLS